MPDDPFPDEPRLLWHMLSDAEKICVVSQLPEEIEDWEMTSGLYVRIDDDTVVYVEPIETH